MAFYILFVWGTVSLLVMIGILASKAVSKSRMSEEEKIAGFERDARETQEYYRAWMLKKDAKRNRRFLDAQAGE